MQFKKSYIVIFIISIIGLAVVQYQYLRIGLNLAKVQFNEKMGKATTNIKEGLEYPNELSFLVGKAITNDSTYFKLSIDSVQDASRYYLNDFLKDKLLQEGIQSDFSYSLYSKGSADYLKSPKRYSENDNLLKYPIVLTGYLPALVDKRLVLELQFKNINNYFMSQLNGLTIPSLIFLAVILFVIFWVLKSFYWQRNVITTTNEFINNLTHELKTPVFSIGLATKILEEKSNGSNKEVISLIRSQVDKLKIQIDKVLELANMENRKHILEKKVVDFKPTLEKIAMEFSELASLEDFEFTSTIEGNSFMLKCESSHLENAINSLLDNARKYTNERPVIKLSATIIDDFLHISVSDKGIGIPKEYTSKIFEKFFRIGNEDQHDVKGYGLGLNYVKRVIKLHKGSILVESEAQKGAEFIIDLPLYRNGK